MDAKLLTSDDVADILGVDPHTLAVWRCTGRYDLPYVKTGRLVHFSRCRPSVEGAARRTSFIGEEFRWERRRISMWYLPMSMVCRETRLVEVGGLILVP
jgi:hypothetical protein